jgi:ATPase family associated with various cellular activities (AAA)
MKKNKAVFRDDLDDFIVSDDDVDDHALTFSSLHRGHDSSPFGSLTNVILLSGPSGCGKSCSVYACANELGWDVFEVWPGIGKRGSRDLFGYVGDVINNRVVESRGQEKQVVILLEEVDLLWSEDKSFWEGVVDLASKSKRPIVMTCNGASLLSIRMDRG